MGGINLTFLLSNHHARNVVYTTMLFPYNYYTYFRFRTTSYDKVKNNENVVKRHYRNALIRQFILRGMPRILVPRVLTRIKHHSGSLLDLLFFISH